MSVETHSFQAESKQLLELMTHSIYSNKEIFLRELISNASDAIDRLRFEALTNKELQTDDFEIRIEADKDKRTLTIKDNGIGMSKDEVISNIGTIAKSGTKELLQKIKEAKEQTNDDVNLDMIGQFGIGFYSAFMVADKVSFITKRPNEDAVKWVSTGDGTYEISEIDRQEHGTEIILELKKADEEDGLSDFVDQWVIQDIVKRYSDFVRYPIRMKIEKTTYPEPSDKDDDKQPEPKTEVVEETLNSMKAIWLRSSKDVTDEEYQDFYKHISHDWNEPLTHINMKAEGRLEYQALLYLPSKAPFDLYYQGYKSGLQLYVKNVKIMEHCEDLLPTYLRFVRGVVDSPDLPLNVSREILQHNKIMAHIKKSLTKKVLDTLKEMLADDYQKYLGFWKEFGKAVKEGLSHDFDNKDKLADLLLFESSRDEEKLTSLKEYKARMKDHQKEIYYLTGESRAVIENSPHLEAFKDKGYEVLYMTDPVDELLTQYLTEYDETKLKSIGKGNVDLGSDEEKEQAKKDLEEKQESLGPLLETIKTSLEEHIKEVRLSSRLTSSPVCLVVEEQDYSPHLERLLKQNALQDLPQVKRIMEINPKHEMIEKLSAIYKVDEKDERIPDYAQLLYGHALLSEGSQLPEPANFTKLLGKLMTTSL